MSLADEPRGDTFDDEDRNESQVKKLEERKPSVLISDCKKILFHKVFWRLKKSPEFFFLYFFRWDC